MTEEHNPLDTAEPERAAAEYAEEERRQRDQENSDLCKVMGNKEGRRFMWRLLSRAGVYRLSYQPGMDAMTTAFNEGYRNTGLELMADMLTICPHLHALMAEEQKQTKDKHEQRLAERRNKQPRR